MILFLLHFYQNYQKQKRVYTKIWAPCRVYIMHYPLWKDETRQCHGLLTMIFWKDQVMTNPKGFKCSDSLDLALTMNTETENSWCSQAAEGYKKIVKCFQMPVSSGQNAIRKGQESGTVEIKASKNIIQKSRIVRKASKNPSLTAGVLVCYSTIKRFLYKYGLNHNLLTTKIRVWSLQIKIGKPDALWKQVLLTQLCWSERAKECLEKKGHRTEWKKNSVQLLIMGVGQS